MSTHRQLDIFRNTPAGREQRMSLTEAIALTRQSLMAYGTDASTWVMGFSGGKDSTTVATLIDWFIQSGQIPRPENLILVYSDTLMELPSLEHSAHALMDKLANRGWQIRRSVPALHTEVAKTERFFVTMLGKGYPPPNNKFRWCTKRLKTQKIDSIYKSIASEYGTNYLGIDGIRKGESAARDRLILASCSTDDGECGQGWFHKTAASTKLSPILHWRLCLVWDWIIQAWSEYGYPIDGVIETYGGMLEEDPLGFEPPSGRTGCIGCPLVTTGNPETPRPDKALQTVLQSPQWDHLAPFSALSAIYHRLRWDNSCRHFKKSGQKGCLTLAARQWALDEILKIQSESARLALAANRRPYTLISAEEETVIRKLLTARTFPDSTRYAPEELASDKPLAVGCT